jgi:hypothetical protein
MTGLFQSNRNINHRPLVRNGKKEEAIQARRIIETMVSIVVDPGRNPASAKSI